MQTITIEDTNSLNTIFEKDKNTIINNNEIYRNNKKDIKPFVDKYIALIQQCKTDNIINKIIEQYTHLIDNVLDIPQTTEEYTDIKILLDTIQKYFNAKVDYMLTLNKNDLENSAFRLYPGLGRLKDRLLSLKLGKFVRMTGSGSTIVIYFNSKVLAKNAFKIYKRKLNKNWCILSKII